MAFLDFNSDRVRRIAGAAYDFQGSISAWADGVHEALGPALDLGQGTLVTWAVFPERGLKLQHVASRGGASRVHHAVVRLSAFLAPEKLRESFFNGRVLGSSSGHYAEDEFSRMQRRARGAGSRDAAGFCVNDSVDHGFMVVSPTREPLRLSAQPSATLIKLGQHISTGLRLQRVITSVRLEDPAVEAIFDSDGRTQHAGGMARGDDALERLRDSVAARSRSTGFTLDDDCGAWQAVCAGRWSLVDRFDSDGRRFVVAYRNPPGVLDPRRLTPREESVAALAALGQSNKEIAVTLEITASTVATLLAAALAKLGLLSRTQLPIFWRDLQGRPWAIDPSEAALVALSHREDPSGMDVLTPAERAVAKGILDGMSDKDIARARNGSRRTVARHAAAIYRKLGVRSRVELARKLAATGVQTSELRGGSPPR
jgi:DNA-binding NarL/FixJ family response regulator